MQAQILSELGYSIDIATGMGPVGSDLISRGLEGIDYYRFPSLTKYLVPRLDAKAFYDLFSFFRRGRYSIVHTHLAKAGILGRLAAALARVPIIIHDVHGPSFSPAHSPLRRALFMNLERLAGVATTHYVFYARHLKDAFESASIGTGAVRNVIYPDLNLQPFFDASNAGFMDRSRLRSCWGLSRDHLVVGYVARMVPSKAHHLAMEAFAALAERWPNARLLLVGGAIWDEEQAYVHRLRSLAANLRLDDRVIFAGHQTEIIPFYEMMDLFVMPSLYEGTANAMLEALAIGLPIVSFDTPTVREFGPPQAIICPFGQVSGLANGLQQAMTALGSSPDSIRPSLDFRRILVHKFSTRQWRKAFTDFYRNLSLG